MSHPRTNLSGTRGMVRALRRRSCIGPEHAALIALAESTAKALDAASADDEGKKYAVALVARAHLQAVQSLLAIGAGESLDPFTAFVAGLSTPTLD